MALRIEGTTPDPREVAAPSVPPSVPDRRADERPPEDRADITPQAAIEHENQAAAESAVADVDKAAAAVEATRRQIVEQAGTSVAAQANTSAAGVLALLR